MADEWALVRLGEVADLLTGFPFKSERYVEDDSAPRLLRGDNVAQGTLRWDGVKRWPADAVDGLAQFQLRAGDVVLAMDRPWIEAGLKYATVRKADLPAYLVQRVARLRGSARLDARFLRYAIGGRAFTNHVLALQTGTAIPHISGGQVQSFEFLLPSPVEQRAIAHILGTLDDKIELNRRMSETLEAMARALFKSWFVDFDPVRAKSEGRDPGLPKHLADLFPGSFVDSELREIPKGWRAVPLPNAIEVNPARKLRRGDVAPYLDMANMPTVGHTPDTVVDRRFGSGMRFVNGDTLVARITPCLENGKTAFVDFLVEGQVGWGSTEYIVFRPNSPLPAEFAYCLARSTKFRDFAIQSMTGSSGRQRVPAESMAHYKIAIPTPDIAERFGQIARNLIGRASSNAHESRTLSSLRDSLLPKLISGELRVKDAERFVARTAA
jgi:type I restriction enzyme S subunit